MKKSLTFVLALAVAAGLFTTSGAVAQSESPTGQPAQGEAPAAAQDTMQDMMGGQEGGMDGMMGMMNMMTQMNEMMGACTKMMQAMTPEEGAPAEQDEQPNRG